MTYTLNVTYNIFSAAVMTVAEDKMVRIFCDKKLKKVKITVQSNKATVA